MDQRLIDYLDSIGADPDALDGWEVSIATRGGVDVAIVAVKGCEIHFVSLVGPRAMSRRNIAQYMQPLFDKYGYCTTRVLIEESDHKLREHLGFAETWRDSTYSYWLCPQPPYQRKTNEAA